MKFSIKDFRGSFLRIFFSEFFPSCPKWSGKEEKPLFNKIGLKMKKGD